ncbi:hypothetical protein BANRA_02268 [Escherichia coli]|nr:hypothetical protein BANRA_02268 [Escherichia coli]VCZ25075.1 hypothetical protein BANRA_03132 [Escherichia coli]
MSKEYMNDGSLSEKWKYRFNFMINMVFRILGQHQNIKQHLKH